MHGIRDYSRLSVKRQGAHLKSLEKQRRASASRDGREARREILRDRSSPRVRRHYFCWPLHLNAILSAWAKYVIYGSRVSRTTEGFTALGTQGHPSGGPSRGILLPYRCIHVCVQSSFLSWERSFIVSKFTCVLNMNKEVSLKERERKRRRKRKESYFCLGI